MLIKTLVQNIAKSGTAHPPRQTIMYTLTLVWPYTGPLIAVSTDHAPCPKWWADPDLPLKTDQ